MAEAVEGEVARNGEKKRLGRRDLAAFPGPQEAQIGFLHQVIEIVLGPEAAPQPRAQDRLVRLHVGGEPLAKFGIGRGHRKRAAVVNPALFANSRADFRARNRTPPPPAAKSTS